MIRRIIIFICLLCFVIAAILQGAALFAHEEHGHEHNCAEICTECVLLKSLKNPLKSASEAAIGDVLLPVILFGALALIFSVSHLKTPIKLKTRMNY